MEIDTTRHICQNCGHEYEGKFCPQCGQRCELQRITFGNVVSHVFEAVTSLDARVPRTLCQLMYRPGDLIVDYLHMRRVRYSNPFGLLLVLATIFVIISNYVLPVNIADLSSQVGGDLVDLTSGGSPEDVAINDQARAFGDQFSKWIYTNYGVFLMFCLPAFTLPLRLAFHTRRGALPGLNLCECATISAYMTCQMEFVSIIAMPLTLLNNIYCYSIATYLVLIPLTVFTLWQMLRLPLWHFVLRLCLFGILLAVFSFLMMIPIMILVPMLLPS